MLKVKLKILLIVFGSLYSLGVFSQGASCGAATSLTSAAACANTGFSIAGGNSGLGSSSCVSAINDDAWHTFVATGITSTVNLSGATNNVAAVVYSGTCGALTEIGCGDGGTTSATAAATTVVGVTYYVRIIRTNNGGGAATTGSICVTGTSAPINLVTNGDFSSGTSSWTDCGNSTEIMNTSQWHGGVIPYTPNNFAELDAGVDQILGNADDAMICQNISGFTIGGTYSICMDVMRRPGPSNCPTTYSQPGTVTSLLGIDNGALNTSITNSSTTWSWTNVCFSFTATSLAHQLTINSSDPSSCGLLITNISIVAPLPVELLSFDAIVEKKEEVILIWQTLTEINNSHFTIEKSVNAKDWEFVGVIDGAGNSSSIIAYKTIDLEPYQGVSYYRLKQTDFNGSFKYSEIKSVRFDEDNFKVYPNPATERLTVIGELLTKSDVHLYNMLGEKIGQNLLQLKMNEAGVEIDVSRLSPGVYVLNINSEIHKIRKL